MTFSFEILKKGPSFARLGIIHTRSGDIQTPAFVPVATTASIKSLDSQDLENIGAQCHLANTYHLYLRPGLEVLEKAGGVKGLMKFNKPLFSDSGGFQAFSLGLGMEQGVGKVLKNNFKKKPGQQSFAKVTDRGVQFKSIYDGSKHFLDPKLSMHIQSVLGSDIIMAFDECTSPLCDKRYMKIAMDRTHEWAKECLEFKDPKQALYGIVQGGEFEDLRVESAKFINSLPFEGIAIGGTFGDSVDNMYTVLDWVAPILDDRPKHLLGIGNVKDIFMGVERGIDTFDCVSPTRNARRGTLFVRPESGGDIKRNCQVNIDHSQYKLDFGPIDAACTCSVCKTYSRAYLQHLFRIHNLTYHRLATIHNLHFMMQLMQDVRDSLANDTFLELKQKWLSI